MNNNSDRYRYGCLALAVLAGLLLLLTLWSCRLQPPFAPPPPTPSAANAVTTTQPYDGWPGEAALRFDALSDK